MLGVVGYEGHKGPDEPGERIWTSSSGSGEAMERSEVGELFGSIYLLERTLADKNEGSGEGIETGNNNQKCCNCSGTRC